MIAGYPVMGGPLLLFVMRPHAYNLDYARMGVYRRHLLSFQYWVEHRTLCGVAC